MIGMSEQIPFPPAIGQPATRALHHAGVAHLEQLTEYTAKEILALHGVGPKAIRILTEEMAARGMSFAQV